MKNELVGAAGVSTPISPSLTHHHFLLLLQIVLRDIGIPSLGRGGQEGGEDERRDLHLEITLRANLAVDLASLPVPPHHPNVVNGESTSGVGRHWVHGGAQVVWHRRRIPIKHAVMNKIKSFFRKISALKRVLLLIRAVIEADRAITLAVFERCI